MAGKQIRDINPILQRVRNWLLGHEVYRPTHRIEGVVSSRTQPKPNPPPSMSSSLSNNYYLGRDGRRDAEPPVKVFVATQKLIEEKEAKPQKPVIPGYGWNWDTGKPSIKK